MNQAEELQAAREAGRRLRWIATKIGNAAVRDYVHRTRAKGSVMYVIIAAIIGFVLVVGLVVGLVMLFVVLRNARRMQIASAPTIEDAPSSKATSGQEEYTARLEDELDKRQ